MAEQYDTGMTRPVSIRVGVAALQRMKTVVLLAFFGLSVG